tara:strand:+ start:249 stop:563 length:315 start_codon:yes stop_codon:yes gene_type:complete
MQDGECSVLTMPAHLTGETESGLLLPTPTANEGGRNKSASPGSAIRPSLGMMAKRNMWPDADMPCGSLNPAFSEWMMGWPIGWTDLRPLAMDKFQQWLNKHGGR